MITPKHRPVALVAVAAFASQVAPVLTGGALEAARARTSSAVRLRGSADASRPQACTASRLVVWLDTRGNGAAGSVYYDLEFTSLAPRSCMLDGYPDVSATSLTRRRLGDAAARNHQLAARVVTLAPGATATAVLQLTQAANYPAATCHQVTAAGLRVVPPGSRTARVVPFPFAACSRRGLAFLHVGVVTLR
jgi:hypothetical protein